MKGRTHTLHPRPVATLEYAGPYWPTGRELTAGLREIEQRAADALDTDDLAEANDWRYARALAERGLL